MSTTLINLITLLLVLFLNLSCDKQIAQQYYNKAYKFEERDQFKEAIHLFNKAIKYDPEFVIEYLDRAIDISILGDFNGAIMGGLQLN